MRKGSAFKLCVAVFISAYAVGDFAALAQQPLPTVTNSGGKVKLDIEDDATETITLVPGFGKKVGTSAPFSTVQVANPNIIDALPLTDSSLYLVAKVVGRTNITIVDANHDVLVSFNVVVDEFPGSRRVQVYSGNLSNPHIFECVSDNCQSFGPESTTLQDSPTSSSAPSTKVTNGVAAPTSAPSK